MGHDILEVASVPRERDKLRALIGTARYARRRSRMMRMAAGVMAAVAAGIMMLHGCSAAPAAPADLPSLYLPLITTEINL